jgi:hypothetical protein
VADGQRVLFGSTGEPHQHALGRYPGPASVNDPRGVLVPGTYRHPTACVGRHGGTIGGSPVGRRDAVVRDRKVEPVLITNAPEDPERELRRRELRYVAMMMLRAACLVVAAILASVQPPLWGMWVVICLVAMVLLPWFAVLLANDRPAKKRSERFQAPEVPVMQTALPAPRHNTIDGDI